MSSAFDLCLLLYVIRVAGWLKHWNLSLSQVGKVTSVYLTLNGGSPDMVYLKQAGWREVIPCTSARSFQAKYGCHERVAMQKYKRGSRHSRQEQAQHQAIRQILVSISLQTEMGLRWTRQLLSQLLFRYALLAHSPRGRKEMKAIVVHCPLKTQSSYMTSHGITLYCSMPEWCQKRRSFSDAWFLAKAMVQ